MDDDVVVGSIYEIGKPYKVPLVNDVRLDSIDSVWLVKAERRRSLTVDSADLRCLQELSNPAKHPLNCFQGALPFFRLEKTILQYRGQSHAVPVRSLE